MLNVTHLKMDYYPLSEAEGVKLSSLLSFSEPASVMDRCVGQGTALQLVTSDAPVRRYGILCGRQHKISYVAQRFMWRSLLGRPEDVPARAEKGHIT